MMLVRNNFQSTRIAALVLVLISIAAKVETCDAAISCFTDGECISKLRTGSLCIQGTCSNPFVRGCLSTILGDENHGFGERVCNSDEIKAGSTDCVDYTQQFGYPEIRVHNSNWESSIFNAWVIQILLMEVLKVPVTVGLASENTPASSFYSLTNTLEYSSAAYPWDALANSNEGPCEDTTEPCVHILPEVWVGQQSAWTQAVNDGVIEPVEGNGQVGKISWYVPAFTARKDPALVSFYGLQGEQNRHKLAAAFKNPTTWKEYCDEVSPDNCTTPDDTAQAYPPEGPDGDKYYSPPGYTGHFRLLPQDNCTAFPDTCQGNFIAPPCTWSTNVDSQLFWNDIKMRPLGPLEPYGGYGYSAMIQIWRAAVHTKSDIIMWWWRPEALTEEFYGTDGQFQQVLLPETTHACSQNRIKAEDRCSADIAVRRGVELGSCDQEAHSLRKLIAVSLKEDSESSPAAIRSPGYAMIKNLKVTDLEMDSMLTDWILKGVDPYGNDAREAVCGWVAENLADLLLFLPPGYPKELSQNSPYDTGFMQAAKAVAGFAGIIVLLTAACAYMWRGKRVFIYAQSHIVSLILVGFSFIIAGSFLSTLKPTDSLCVARSWLINLGYTIELVPILVKIAAINKILASAKKMKRVQITRQGMLFNVGVALIPVLVYLIVWTVVDPPREFEQRILSEENSATIELSLTCKSDDDFWFITTLAWQALLLLMATVLAFQSRDIVQEFNESRSLGTMIYSHFLFMILRGIAFNLGQQEILLPNAVAGVTSVLLSLDTIFAIIIYLVPKCIEAKVGSSQSTSGSGSMLQSFRSSQMVSQIQARALAAQVSYLSSGQFHTDEEKDGSASSGGKTSSERARGARGPSSKFQSIQEESNESESESCSAADSSSRASTKNSAKNSKLSGSFRMDAAGNIIASDVTPSESRVARKRSSNHSARSSGFSSSSLTPSQLEKLRDNDDNSSDEEHDSGGPRFTSAVHNEILERSVRYEDKNMGSSMDAELEALQEESEHDESTSTTTEMI